MSTKKAPAKLTKPAKSGAKAAARAKSKPDKKPIAKPPARVVARVTAKIQAKAHPKAEKPRVPDRKADGRPARPGETEHKAGPKGITVVTPKPVRKAKPGSNGPFFPPTVGRLLDPKSPSRKPLIPSGPKAAGVRPLGQHGGMAQPAMAEMPKSPFKKEELDQFRQLLLKKRHELVGDVKTMEDQALQGSSGSLSNMPSHLAEQGSEAYDQSLSLDLAAADRKIIREIDDALKRIDEGTYGVCELTGKAIKIDRLRELPWARYSIEAAREIERQSMRPI